MTSIERIQALDRNAELTGLIAETQYLVDNGEYWDLAAAGIGQAGADQVKAQHLELLADFERLLAENEELHRSPPPSLRKQLATVLLKSLEKQEQARLDQTHSAREGEGRTDAK